MSLLRGRRYNRLKKSHGGEREAKYQNDTLFSTAHILAEQHGVSPKTIERSPANFTESIIEAIRSAKPGMKIGEVVALRDAKGGRPKKDENLSNLQDTPPGNSNERVLRRLARDNPKFLNKIESGELTVNQAATTIELSPVIDDSCRQAGRFQAVFSGFATCSFSNVFASVFFQNH
jgi:hypothetical protein